jgi:hypothetical protein
VSGHVPGGQFARQALAGALERGEAIGTSPVVVVAMREALRDIAALAARWRAGASDVGPAAAAEVYDAIRGELAQQQPAQAAEEDQPWRGGGVRPGE